ncbi:MAG: cytochrome c3 family protein [Candidatus Sulfobium sp.]
MKTYGCAMFLSLMVLMFAAGALARDAPNACITCHEYLGGQLAEPVKEWKTSIHEQNGITCDLCHGGDASINLADIDKLSPKQFADIQARAMSKSHGFIGKPSGKAMFDLCGQCHSASVDRYAGSIMGKAYLGNRGGPSCVTCHNAHNNVIPSVPKVCENCHKDTTGFDRMDPMNVTESTLNELSGIRIRLAEEKARGKRPPLAPEFPEELGSFQIGFIAFGVVIVIFIMGYLVYVTLEKRKP